MATITRAKPHLPIEEVKERMNTDPRSWCRKRWLIIYNALVDPREASEIAKHTGVSVSTVHKVISLYNKFGVSSVETAGKGGRRFSYLTREEEQDFLEPFFERAEKGEIATTAEIQQAFERKVGHEVDSSTVYRLLDRHEWRKIVPRSFHPQARKEDQEHFQQHFPDMIKEIMKARDPTDERPVLILAQDEARFGLISDPRRSWAPKPVRPLVARKIARHYTYVYAAVAPETGEMTALILPATNTSMMNIFLHHVSTRFSNSFLIMQVDQAGWHRAKDLVIPENIRFIYQPAYSPELNPAEHLWDEIREKAFSNRTFPSLDAVIDTLCEQLLRLENNSQLLRSMTYFPHFRMAS
jgi:transposase